MKIPILLLAVLFLGGCASQPGRESAVTQGGMPHDAPCFHWDKNGAHSYVYYWGGRKLGENQKGLDRLMVKLGDLPKGAVAYYYPRMIPTLILSGDSTYGGWNYPFNPSDTKFNELKTRKGITIRSSDFDENGKPVPARHVDFTMENSNVKPVRVDASIFDRSAGK